MDKTIKVIAIVLAIIIVILLGLIIFLKPTQAPTVPVGTNASSSQGVTSYDGTITITMPGAEDTLITSPVGIEGTATGNWFNEATFPVRVLDGDGTMLGRGTAQALGDWMTSSSVAFSANIAFTAPKYATGTILFMSDDPSGNPLNEHQFGLEVRFK